MDEIADDSAAQVEEGQGAAHGLGHDETPPRWSREAFAFPWLRRLLGSRAGRARTSRRKMQPLSWGSHTTH